jgi:TonB family protein
MNERSIRKAAKVTALPHYPSGSIALRKAGVSVVGIRIDVDGQVQSAQVLEAPDEAIGRATTAAAREWVFEPIFARRDGGRVPARVDSKLTFYFAIDEKGTAVVIDPIRSSSSTQMAATPSPAPGGGVREVSEREFSAMSSGMPGILLIDVRPREDVMAVQRPGVVNIPVDELVTRSRELEVASVVAIDCFADYGEICAMAVDELLARTFVRDVWIVRRREPAKTALPVERAPPGR